jgi:hypothetical protein
MDKLIEFEMGDENAYIHQIFTYGRYLYAVVSAKTDISRFGEMIEEITQLTVVRIDLEEENACVLYSDNKNMDDRDKIENLIYNKNHILCSADGVIYICDPDMRIFQQLTTDGYGNIRHLDINDRDIYVSAGDTLYGFLYNIEYKSYGLKMILGNINDFCVDDGFLYYTLHDKNGIYKVKLDTGLDRMPYMDYFINSTVVYTSESGYSIKEWNVRNDYIYTLLYSADSYTTLSRVKANSNSVFYIFKK